MIEVAITFLVLLLVLAVVVWAARPALAHLGAPEFVWKIIVAIVVLLAVLWLFGNRLGI